MNELKSYFYLNVLPDQFRSSLLTSVHKAPSYLCMSYVLYYVDIHKFTYLLSK